MQSILWCWEQRRNQGSDCTCDYPRRWGSRHCFDREMSGLLDWGPGSGFGLCELVESPLLTWTKVCNWFVSQNILGLVSFGFLSVHCSRKYKLWLKLFHGWGCFLPALPDELTQWLSFLHLEVMVARAINNLGGVFSWGLLALRSSLNRPVVPARVRGGPADAHQLDSVSFP